MMKVVAYKRVSTQKQGRSGLGLEAQERAIGEFVASRRAHVVGQYVEIESGKNRDRPQLAAALHHAKVTGATLVIAKLDRLSRSASFTLALRDSGVHFVCCDMPEANGLTIGVLAVVAQAEAEAISRRTRDALSVARTRVARTGQNAHRHVKRLGNPNGAAALRRANKGNLAACEKVRRNADRHAFDLSEVIAAFHTEGIESLSAIARGLNAREILTRRGRRWHPSSVRNLLRRLAVHPGHRQNQLQAMPEQ